MDVPQWTTLKGEAAMLGINQMFRSACDTLASNTICLEPVHQIRAAPDEEVQGETCLVGHIALALQRINAITSMQQLS